MNKVREFARGQSEHLIRLVQTQIQTVFEAHLWQFQTVFVKIRPLGMNGVDLQIPKVTLGSRIGGLDQKLWPLEVRSLSPSAEPQN